MNRHRLVGLAVGVAALAVLVAAPSAGAVAGGPISGTPQVGETLTASSSLGYQWQRCDPTAGPCNSSGGLWFLDAGWSNIGGATAQTYTLTNNDLGKVIRVIGSSLVEGVIITVASPKVGPVVEAAPTNTSPPTVSGNAREGSTLNSTDGTWTGSNLSFDRQWQRSDGGGGWDDISGATGSSYTLTAADIGRQLRLEVVATGDGGESDPAHSNSVGPILALPPSNTDEPTITGNPAQGETLTVDDGSWQSSVPFTTSRQWFRSNDGGGFDPTGETGPTYLLTAADVGHTIEVRVVATNSGGNSPAAKSNVVGPVAAAAPANTERPSISGNPVENQTLTGDDGEWTGFDLTFTRQWQRSTDARGGGAAYEDIPGADESTYKLTFDDVGHTIRLEVTASGPGGSETAFSDPTDEVALAPPRFDQFGNLEPVSGSVFAQLPGEDEVRRIEELTRIPFGTKVDVSDGFGSVVTQRGPGEGLQEITVWDGSFVVGQRVRKRLTVLRLSQDLIGGPTARSAEAQASARRGGGRRLWGRGRCRCRTRGRNSSGTARGTFWLTAERKRGTFTKVKEEKGKHKVVVRDFTNNERVVVHEGESYLAPNR